MKISRERKHGHFVNVFQAEHSVPLTNHFYAPSYDLSYPQPLVYVLFSTAYLYPPAFIASLVIIFVQ